MLHAAKPCTMGVDMKAKAESVAYYILRIMQRITLLYTALCTVIFWAVLLIVVILIEYSIQSVGHEYQDGEAAQSTITTAVNALSWQVLGAAITMVVVTLAMLAFRRVRRDEKRLVVDSVVVGVFCVVSVVLAQFAVQYFIHSKLAG